MFFIGRWLLIAILGRLGDLFSGQLRKESAFQEEMSQSPFLLAKRWREVLVPIASPINRGRCSFFQR